MGSPLFVDKLYEAGAIDQPIFAILATNDPKNQEAEITFGRYDDKSYNSSTMSITAHDIHDTTWWVVAMNRIEFGDKMKIKPSTHGAILDTGTSMIMGYYEDVNQIQAA